jgi:hypothetical protein
MPSSTGQPLIFSDAADGTSLFPKQEAVQVRSISLSRRQTHTTNEDRLLFTVCSGGCGLF